MMELIAVTYDQERTVMVRDRTSNNYICSAIKPAFPDSEPSVVPVLFGQRLVRVRCVLASSQTR